MAFKETVFKALINKPSAKNTPPPIVAQTIDTTKLTINDILQNISILPISSALQATSSGFITAIIDGDITTYYDIGWASGTPLTDNITFNLHNQFFFESIYLAYTVVNNSGSNSVVVTLQSSLDNVTYINLSTATTLTAGDGFLFGVGSKAQYLRILFTITTPGSVSSFFRPRSIIPSLY